MKIVGLWKSVSCWRNQYGELMEKEVEDKGSIMIECATDAVEHLMQSENQFMKVSGQRSNKV